MRLPRRMAPAVAAVLLIAVLPYEAASADRPARPKRALFGAQCRVAVDGARVRAFCHNPYPGVDAVALHVECAPWWDIDTDSAPREVGPAETVRIDGRCWKQVRDVWVSHRRAGR
ncbi:hypothetical protein [Streptomyces sp. NPDC088785]|uniref:hypothetical protein n=1 Tax=Streptomyces sp. NPDC088785 TaxID=3365897 RepID=UPI00382511EF